MSLTQQIEDRITSGTESFLRLQALIQAETLQPEPSAAATSYAESAKYIVKLMAPDASETTESRRKRRSRKSSKQKRKRAVKPVVRNSTDWLYRDTVIAVEIAAECRKIVSELADIGYVFDDKLDVELLPLITNISPDIITLDNPLCMRLKDGVAELFYRECGDLLSQQDKIILSLTDGEEPYKDLLFLLTFGLNLITADPVHVARVYEESLLDASIITAVKETGCSVDPKLIQLSKAQIHSALGQTYTDTILTAFGLFTFYIQSAFKRFEYMEFVRSAGTISDIQSTIGDIFGDIVSDNLGYSTLRFPQILRCFKLVQENFNATELQTKLRDVVEMAREFHQEDLRQQQIE